MSLVSSRCYTILYYGSASGSRIKGHAIKLLPSILLLLVEISHFVIKEPLHLPSNSEPQLPIWRITNETPSFIWIACGTTSTRWRTTMSGEKLLSTQLFGEQSASPSSQSRDPISNYPTAKGVHHKLKISLPYILHCDRGCGGHWKWPLYRIAGWRVSPIIHLSFLLLWHSIIYAFVLFSRQHINDMKSFTTAAALASIVPAIMSLTINTPYVLSTSRNLELFESDFDV